MSDLTLGRPPLLGRFLQTLQAAARTSLAKDTAADRAARRVFQRASVASQAERSAAPGDLPVCRWLAPAIDLASGGPRRDVAQAFAALTPELAWRRRLSADPADRRFWEGHANAMILGPGGLEERKDIWIGVTLMAPETTYVDHDHPPEEVYLGLTPGEWWNEDMDWTDPGPDGFTYNRPGIRHAMRAGATPFLAIWLLPV